MRSVELWEPSKFLLSAEGMVPTRDRAELSTGSRIVAGRMGRLYATALQRHATGRLLDLGCGKVPLYLAYRDRVSDVTCVDWPGSLHGALHVDHQRDLNVGIDLPSSSFETVLLSDVLEHIREPSRLLSQVNEVLVPGGHVIIGVPFMYWLHEEPHDYHRYTSHALRSMLDAAGMDVVALDEAGGAPEVLADIVGKLLHSRPRIQGAFVGAMERLLSAGRVRRASERTSGQFPLGYVTVGRKRSTQ